MTVVGKEPASNIAMMRSRLKTVSRQTCITATGALFTTHYFTKGVSTVLRQIFPESHTPPPHPSTRAYNKLNHYRALAVQCAEERLVPFALVIISHFGFMNQPQRGQYHGADVLIECGA